MRSAAFGWLDEFSGEQLNVRPARFDAVGVENVRVPFQFEPLLGVNRVELSVGGMRTNTYWIQQGRIVISDWTGARSYAFGDDVARRLLVTLALP